MKNNNRTMMDEQKSEMIPIMVYNLRYDKKYNARFTLKLKCWEVTK